jgi:hypothetical protein
VSGATAQDKSVAEIERELSAATDAYLRRKISLRELTQLEERYRARSARSTPRVPGRRAHAAPAR